MPSRIPMHRATGLLLAALALCILLAAAPARACSVPVFRYALDRWPADSFHLEAATAVFGEEPLATVLRNLGQNGALNLEASPSNEPGREARLFHPTRPTRERHLFWNGSLDAARFAELTDSPARRELQKRILAGHSAVWILVHSGNADADNEADALIEKRLRFLEQAAALPRIDPNDPTSKLGPGPALRIQLSLLRIERKDPAEASFLRMLAGPAGLDPLPADQPFAALVFGRGRVLGAWASPEESTIEEATMFLLSACSCEVKNLNPGWDLLMTADWQAGLQKAEQERIAATDSPTTPPAQSVTPQTVVFTPGNTPAKREKPSTTRWRLWLILGAGLPLLLAWRRRSTP